MEGDNECVQFRTMVLSQDPQGTFEAVMAGGTDATGI